MRLSHMKAFMYFEGVNIQHKLVMNITGTHYNTETHDDPFIVQVFNLQFCSSTLSGTPGTRKVNYTAVQVCLWVQPISLCDLQ